MNAVYEYKKFLVYCRIKNYSDSRKYNEKNKIVEYINETLNIDEKDIDVLIEIANEIAKPVREYLNEFKEKIKSALGQNSLFHVSEAQYDVIQKSVDMENMYHNSIYSKIYATSSLMDIAVYCGRAVVGRVMLKNKICVYKDCPFKCVTNSCAVLKKNIYGYKINSESFEPVIDFYRTTQGHFAVRFDNEWISDEDSLLCKSEVISEIPIKIYRDIIVYYMKTGNLMAFDDSFNINNTTFEECFDYCVANDMIELLF
jgi:hypothetical protein